MQAPTPERAPQTFAEYFTAMTAGIEQIVKGKTEVVQLVLLSLLAEGHVLLEDNPGVGKTTIGKSLAKTIDVPFGRVQFTPDLLPSDVVGVSVWNRETNEFEFRPGPIFNGIVLADEVNRTSAKTQSALLEAMAERQVTADGTTRHIKAPFMVIATQNPLDHLGTYALPESQLDRFLVKVSVGYPTKNSEREILTSQGGDNPMKRVKPVLDGNRMKSMIAAARAIHCAPATQDYLIDIVSATRQHPSIALGASPRAAIALQSICRARAAAEGRTYITPDDVKALAAHVLSHRLILTPEAEAQNLTPQNLIAQIIARTPTGNAV